MSDAPAAAAAPPALSSPEAVDFLAMLAERQTATEVRQDALSARLDALSASFTAYTAVMPIPIAYCIVLEVTEDTLLADMRCRVLEAVAPHCHGHPEQVSVRCTLHNNGVALWRLRPHMRAAFIFVCAAFPRNPAAAAPEFPSLHVSLARCGTRVLETHAVMGEMEELYFLYRLQDNEVFAPIRVAELRPKVPGEYNVWGFLTADFALGWCRRIQVRAVDEEDIECALKWSELVGFSFYVPPKSPT